jgi:hypothetical protein
METNTPNQRLDDILNTITTIYNNHVDDEFFISSLSNKINNIEDKIFLQKEEHNKRVERKTKLNSERELFVKTFMQTHKYYYISESDIFIEYDGNHYVQLTESKIWSEIFNEINKNHTLIPWKQKVRIELISAIKKNTIFNIQLIPESRTIQRVLQILQSILLPNKYYCKYFLTLLGDCLLRKNDTNNSIIPTNNCDTFLQELEFQIHHYMKCYFRDSFKHKYYNHSYENIRIIQTKECNDNAFMWDSMIKKYIFDIIFVACHYSKRFENADNYLLNYCNNNETTDCILFCKNNTKECILDTFVTNMFERNDKLCVFKKDLKYLINQYFDLINIPKVLFYTDVEEYFNKNFETITNEYDVIQYKGITSKDSHFISSFLSFFNETFDVNSNYITQFELDEVLFIYSKKCRHKNYLLNEKMLQSLLKHYFDDVEVLNGKYINGIKCNIWDKQCDIDEFMKYIQDNNDETQSNELSNEKFNDSDDDSVTSHDKLYERYCLWCEKDKKQFIVSKDYFEEHV